MLQPKGQLSFYEILLVSPNASREEIDRACLNLWYRYQSMSTTPLWKDLSRQIDEIRQTLLDPQARSAYDKLLNKERPAPPADLAPEPQSRERISDTKFTYPELAAILILYVLTVISGKAPYSIGLVSALVFNQLVEWMSPESWSDILTIGGLVLFCSLAATCLCWCALHLFRMGGGRAIAE